jgi:hypothetical protein
MKILWERIIKLTAQGIIQQVFLRAYRLFIFAKKKVMIRGDK